MYTLKGKIQCHMQLQVKAPLLYNRSWDTLLISKLDKPTIVLFRNRFNKYYLSNHLHNTKPLTL
ncbi:hypothetical protein RYX36_025915 [Vicia faba]